MAKVILHADLNNFYASVACLHRPDLREVPVAVCGAPRAGTASSWPRTCLPSDMEFRLGRCCGRRFSYARA